MVHEAAPAAATVEAEQSSQHAPLSTEDQMFSLGDARAFAGRRPLLALLTALCALGLGAARPAAFAVRAQDAPQPPIADPMQLVGAYYQAFADAVNSGDFSTVVAFFSPDASIDSGLSPGSIAGTAQIQAFFQSLPPMLGFTVDPENVLEDDPYVDADWRFRAAPGSLRGYLDGHDTFTIAGGLITALTQEVDPQAAADAFLPSPLGPAASGQGKATTRVRIQDYKYGPQVIRVAVGATVTWTNNDSDDHTVTSDDKAIDSGVIEQGVSVTLTFPVAGEFPYYCTVHPGMRGKVIVGGQ
jgi:plastocyanin